MLVCHPGGPGFSADHFGDLAALWEQYTLIMLNPRGTGGSSRPGDDDFICGPICAREICASLPDARQVIVGDAGHMTFIEQPQAFHDGVADFLEGSSGRAQG